MINYHIRGNNGWSGGTCCQNYGCDNGKHHHGGFYLVTLKIEIIINIFQIKSPRRLHRPVLHLANLALRLGLWVASKISHSETYG